MTPQVANSRVTASLARILGATWSLLRSGVDSIASRPVLAVAVAGLLTFVGAAAVGLLTGLPIPSVHDEFSYLLQAETFASGRLTNPTPPLWEHFETFHVIMQPTYASKYPPGQGFFLALGEILGHPVLGVWISVSLMVAAITWMLFAWIPPRWAVVTGFIVAVHIGIGSYWAHSYWGGAIAATGGAMVYGALRRAIREPSLVEGVAVGFGLSLLALSRPFEGVIVSLPAAAILVYYFLLHESNKLRSLRRVVAPVTLIVGLTIAFIGLYNWRVTGDPRTFPYVVHNDQYSMTSGFLWSETTSPPMYRHTAIERFYQTWGVERTEKYQDLRTFIWLSTFKTLRNLIFLLGPGLFVLYFLRRAARDRWIQLAAIISGGLMIVSLTTAGSYPHYIAPVTGLIYAVLGACLAAMHCSAPDDTAGARRTMLVLSAFGIFSLIGFTPFPKSEGFIAERSKVRDELLERPGTDLVIVRYGPDHNPHHEWVYNSADIERAEIVWARDMGPSANRELVAEYSGRRVWLLRVGEGNVELQKYRPGPDNAGNARSHPP